jgi:[glutamine synthetase] adenylyltransferase / [glutamine synthetase]-adenylyl-L-tyrosine phosphorylase
MEIESLVQNLPDAESSLRFFNELPSFEANKLLKNQGLLSDILTLVSFSPLLATTISQNKNYITWLARKRQNSQIIGKEELLESLGRFSMTNSQLELVDLFANFRRRELLRIYLKDIRRLGTIAEITEELSILTDAILEYALQIAQQELNNRYGIPLETDDKGRNKQAKFCIMALGKLGSNELNYSSDIDLQFIYSSEGETSGHGTRGIVTNREYFVKLSEQIIKLVGQTFRVDMRLRPHGRIGSLSISLADTVKYYQTEARNWERQVLIRSRACAGDTDLFKDFFHAIENFVFNKDETVGNALRNVRLSKEKINLEKQENKGFNVKLGQGGIREIEFIAQALQLAFGGNDAWLRVSHTLISLSRLADRRLISETELTQLFDAYDFLRRLEHRLQMEHGLQTHFLTDETKKRLLVAKRMQLNALADFDEAVIYHTNNVNQIFERIFSEIVEITEIPNTSFIEKSVEKSDVSLDTNLTESLEKFCKISPHFAEYIANKPQLINNLPLNENKDFTVDFSELEKIDSDDFAHNLSNLRKNWSKCLLQIAVFDAFHKINFRESKKLQTELAEKSLNTAFEITKFELKKRFGNFEKFNFIIFGLGKLGSRGLDYGSDLDLVLVYDDDESKQAFYAKAVELFVTTLSSFTREGSLYRVDLRLRPDGKNGSTCINKSSFFRYLQERAEIWELLAYIKIRTAIGDKSIEENAREIIHNKAKIIDKNDLKNETFLMRERLRESKSGRGIDIKFGEGGLLDVYFAIRYLQLLHDIRDDENLRSTTDCLSKLAKLKIINLDNFENLKVGYEFLSKLDHALRLTLGRSSTLPNNLDVVSNYLQIKDLTEQLTFHRLNIRQAFEEILM